MAGRHLIAATLAASLGGCFWVTTKSEGKRMRHDVKALDARVATKEKDVESQVTELKSTLEEAKKILQRNSADLGASVSDLSEEQRVLTGLVTAAQANAEEVRQGFDEYKKSTDARLAALEAKLVELERKPVAPKETAEDLWTAGKAAFEAGKFAEARELFKKLALGYASHDKADDAQYFRGETYYSEKSYDAAIGEYQKVFDKYPDGSFADDAMFRAGEAAAALKNCTEAVVYFEQLKTSYPKSNLAKSAGEKAKALKAAAKDKKKCTS